jgi:hypothetical protein
MNRSLVFLILLSGCSGVDPTVGIDLGGLTTGQDLRLSRSFDMGVHPNGVLPDSRITDSGTSLGIDRGVQDKGIPDNPDHGLPKPDRGVFLDRGISKLDHGLPDRGVSPDKGIDRGIPDRGIKPDLRLSPDLGVRPDAQACTHPLVQPNCYPLLMGPGQTLQVCRIPRGCYRAAAWEGCPSQRVFVEVRLTHDLEVIQDSLAAGRNGMDSWTYHDGHAQCAMLSLPGATNCWEGQPVRGPYTCTGWRTATAAEFEYIYRGGTTSDFYDGSNLNQYCQRDLTKIPTTNGWGLKNMLYPSLTLDDWRPTPGQNEVDPVGPPNDRIIRASSTDGYNRQWPSTAYGRLLVNTIGWTRCVRTIY